MEHTEINGFTDQNERNKAFINRNKEAEERLLRITDELKQLPEYDQRFIAMSVSYFQIGFMLLNRGVFQPQRIELPEDTQGDIPAMPRPAVYVGEVFKRRDEKNGETTMTGDKGQKLLSYGQHWYLADEAEAYVKAGGKF